LTQKLTLGRERLRVARTLMTSPVAT
jgi:hypothetical protein